MIIKLKNRALIKVSGEDSLTFLQSQLTNDVNKVNSHQIQLNAYCQHQGKVIALLWVFRKNDNYYISIPINLRELFLSKLNMYKLMSRVEIEDLTLELKQYGLINERIENSLVLKNTLSLFTTRDNIEADTDINLWEIGCINNNLPEIYLDTSEQFIPQALNLDIDEIGVSFTKGCYPGQEVVARMHYLGKPKRRLFHFSSKYQANVGDLINVKDSKSLKSSGVILRVAKIDENYHSLGIFEIQHINKNAYLNNDVNKSLIIVNAR